MLSALNRRPPRMVPVSMLSLLERRELHSSRLERRTPAGAAVASDCCDSREERRELDAFFGALAPTSRTCSFPGSPRKSKTDG
jgi:hypothetical protein